MKSLIFLLCLLSNSSFAIEMRRVIPSAKEEIVSSFGKLREGEVFKIGKEPYIRVQSRDVPIYQQSMQARTIIPTLFIKAVQNNGVYEDVVYIGPGKVFINNQELTNTSSIECKPSTVGMGGRLDSAANPNISWHTSFLFLTADPSPTSDRKFNCFLTGQDQNTNIPTYQNLKWMRIAKIPRIWDGARYRNRHNGTVFSGRMESRLNNIVLPLYGQPIATMVTLQLTFPRTNDCIRLFPFEGTIPDGASYDVFSSDHTFLDIFSDSKCTNKIHTLNGTGSGGANGITPVLPPTENGGLYMKGTLGTSTSAQTRVIGTAYSFENMIITN